MSRATLLDRHPDADLSLDHLEQDILRAIEEQEVFSLDALIAFLPDYSWARIFHAVDGLARRGQIVLRRHRFDYTLFSTKFAA